MTYIARYGDGREGILQQLVCFPATVFETVQPPVSWWANFRRITHQVVSAPAIDFAIRLGLRENRFERVLMLLAPRQREGEIVALAAAFLGLNAIVAGSVAVPIDSDDHDKIAAAFPPLRARVLQDTYQSPNGGKGIQLIDAVRLVPAIGSLFDLAVTRGLSFAYQLNACRHRSDAEDLKWSQHNLLRMDEVRNLPLTVRQSQRDAVERMAQATFLIEEFVGSDEDAMGRIGEAVAANMKRPHGFPDELLRVSQTGAFDNQLAIGLHTSRVVSFEPWQKVAAAASREETLDVLDWQPPGGFAQAIGNAARGAESEAEYLRRIEQRLAAIERELADRKPGNQLSECVDFRNALQHARIEQQHALTSARIILDGIIGTIYRQRCKGKDSKPLYNKIEELLEGETSSIFPQSVKTYLHTVRVLGNIVVHKTGDKLNTVDIEITLLALLQIVAWYLLEYRPPGAPA